LDIRVLGYIGILYQKEHSSWDTLYARNVQEIFDGVIEPHAKYEFYLNAKVISRYNSQCKPHYYINSKLTQ
jgi:hypothetical protein